MYIGFKVNKIFFRIIFVDPSYRKTARFVSRKFPFSKSQHVN